MKSDRGVGKNEKLTSTMAEIIMSTKSCISHNTKESQEEGEKKFQLKYLLEEMLRYITLPAFIALNVSLCDKRIS